MRWSGLKFLALLLVMLFPVVPTRALSDTFTDYREQDRTWIVGNRSIQASFQVDKAGRFRFDSLDDRTNGRSWRGSDAYPSSPVNMTVDGVHLNPDTVYAVRQYSFEDISEPARGVRFSVVLTSASTPGEIRFEADVYEGQPFLRYRTFYRNTTGLETFVTQSDMLAWKFQDERETYRDFYVGQWKNARAANFEPHETNVSRTNGAVEMFTGANANHTAWRAIRDSHDFGLVAAWEFNGRALAHVEHQRGTRTLRLDAEIRDLNHRVAPGGVFQVPDAFIGVFRGDWDEAGYRTQRFAEDVLAAPAPDGLPDTMFDTWGYGTDIDESIAMEAAQRAAELGAEVFILDFGWARGVGDWHPDPKKFPNGLVPLSDHVHSLGMKFGLHLPLLEVAADSPILHEHPDWEAVDANRPRRYFGATSLCPSHEPAREWIIAETTRIIQEYHVDWVTQDGENMVKMCDSTTHTHAPGDSNYSNAVDGLDAIVHEVQAATPRVVWENCEDGGSMQTFKMVQQYVTSIVSDSDDALTTRRAVYGATYPFPLSYTERYMMDEPDDTYHTRSYMFGGPVVIMNRITEWSSAKMEFVKRERRLHESFRELMRDAKIYHITARPDGISNDAIEAHDPGEDRSIVFVYSGEVKSGVSFVQPRGLDPNTLYWVGFLEVPHSYLATGAELMQKSIPVIVPRGTTEIISIVRR